MAHWVLFEATSDKPVLVNLDEAVAIVTTQDPQKIGIRMPMNSTIEVTGNIYDLSLVLGGMQHP